MHVLAKPTEQPWAFAVRPDHRLPSGVRYQYYATRDDAEKARATRIRRRKYAGPLEYRLGECRLVGAL